MKKSLFKEIVVWALISLGLIVFSVFSYIIATNTSGLLTAFVTYKTRFPESTGVYVGTKVTIHGKSTGNVSRTVLLPDGNVEIYFTVRKSHAFSITESSWTEMKNSGALGDRFINIVTKDMAARRLKPGSLVPYRETSSILSILTAGGGEAKKSIQGLLSQIDSLAENINKGLLSESRQEDLSEILKSVKNILKKIESGEGTLGALINDRALYNRLLILLGHKPSNSYIQDLSRRASQKLKKER